jgi:hypothetical protein
MTMDGIKQEKERGAVFAMLDSERLMLYPRVLRLIMSESP